MRLWSIHPHYLDSQGLVALWREALLAQKVLSGKTRGYIRHPQLERFKQHSSPMDAIGLYLHVIYLEAVSRGYNFKKDKIVSRNEKVMKVSVSRGQVGFEFKHLLKKVKIRDRKHYCNIALLKKIKVHPLFRQGAGGVAAWEKIQDKKSISGRVSGERGARCIT